MYGLLIVHGNRFYPANEAYSEVSPAAVDQFPTSGLITSAGDGPSHSACAPSHSETLEAALGYRARGFSVLPLDGKQPHAKLIRRTHGTARTSRLAARGADEDQIREWFSSPGVNVGIFCGEPSGGLVVVDFDDCEFPPPGAHLPPTPCVKTGRGDDRGYHLYYRGDGSVLNAVRPWGEVRAVSPVHIVAPPSVHSETGRRYEWLVPLTAAAFADFADVVLPDLTSQRSEAWGERDIRPTKDVLLGPGTTADTPRVGWLQSFDRDPEAVEAMARALGINAPLGQPFCCVLHNESNPSASLHRAESGDWLYHDFHAGRRDGKQWQTLAEVRGRKAGRTLPLSRPELATWKLILLVEAGVLSLVPIPAEPLPPSTPGFVRHVFERFLFLLGCRWNHSYGDAAPFERKFAAALCELPERLAREAINELHRLGAIYVAGKDSRTRLWLPRGCEQPFDWQEEL